MSNLLYITYKRNGKLLKATIKNNQYEQFKKDSSITELQIHPNNFVMENYYKEVCTNSNCSTKKFLND